jgi:hypothetical protein
MTAIKYIHQTPGRLRLKGCHFQCHGERARKAVSTLQALPGVERVTLNSHAGSLTVNYDRQALTQHELLAALDATGCLYVAADVQVAPTAHPTTSAEGVAGAFGKALVGVLAQRTVTRIIGALL